MDEPKPVPFVPWPELLLPPIDGYKYDGRCQVVGCDEQAAFELDAFAPNGTKVVVCEAHRFRDAVHTTVTAEWSLWDRLKILLFGRSFVRVVVRTENVVGRVESESSAWTAPIFPERSVPMVHKPEENPIHA